MAGSGRRFRRQEAGGPEQPLGGGACDAGPARRTGGSSCAVASWADLGGPQPAVSDWQQLGDRNSGQCNILQSGYVL